MPNPNKQKLSVEYSQFPEALKLALIDVSLCGYASTYDQFKAVYVLNGLLLSVWSRSQIDSNQRQRDFFVVTANMQDRSVKEWAIKEVAFTSDKYGSLRQSLLLSEGDLDDVNVELRLTSQGCWLDDQPLAPLAELEGKLSDIHYRHGHQVVRAFILAEEEQAAIVAA